MGMYTELNIGVEVSNNKDVIQKLRFMLMEPSEDVEINHPLFKTSRWSFMLRSTSGYFDGRTDSRLYEEEVLGVPRYYLNVRCNLKNYDNEIEKFLDWLSPYILTRGFLGYMRDEDEEPTLLYLEDKKVIFKRIAKKGTDNADNA